MAQAAKKTEASTSTSNVTPIFRSKSPTHKLFQLPESGTDGPFRKCGAAWTNSDGSLNISMDFIPLPDSSGRVRLQLRENKFYEQDTAKQRAAFEAEHGSECE